MKLINLCVVSFLFLSCQDGLSNKEKNQYTIKGKEIVLASANHLGGQLVEVMNEGGVVQAVPFCNMMAIHLTNEMSEKYNATIKRTSSKLRNMNNKPNGDEAKILLFYKNLLDTNKQPIPIVELDKSGNPHFYSPILLQQKCLACHGDIGVNVTHKTDSIIKSYYPDDLATGFEEGDLRGIWSITFQSD